MHIVNANIPAALNEYITRANVNGKYEFVVREKVKEIMNTDVKPTFLKRFVNFFTSKMHELKINNIIKNIKNYQDINVSGKNNSISDFNKFKILLNLVNEEIKYENKYLDNRYTFLNNFSSNEGKNKIIKELNQLLSQDEKYLSSSEINKKEVFAIKEVLTTVLRTVLDKKQDEVCSFEDLKNEWSRKYMGKDVVNELMTENAILKKEVELLESGLNETIDNSLESLSEDIECAQNLAQNTMLDPEFVYEDDYYWDYNDLENTISDDNNKK